MSDENERTWETVLKGWSGKGRLFGPDFLHRYGNLRWSLWKAGDIAAAAEFHIELISRVATRRLGYREGDEATALKSMHLLFERARQLTASPGAEGAFGIVVWHTLNAHVRPFTSKWHKKSEQGALRALDATDIFRGELEGVQDRLSELSDVLVLVCGTPRYELNTGLTPPQDEIKQEMERSVTWRPHGCEIAAHPIDPSAHNMLNLAEAERELVLRRRRHYSVEREDWAAGLALSGGGARSATFAIGVLAALGRRNLLPQFDYLSTVSGGGYAGAFLTQLLSSRDAAGDENIGLRESELPFKRDEGESALLQKVRNSIAFLTGSILEKFGQLVAYAQGIFINVLVITLVTFIFAFIDLYTSSFANSLSWILGTVPIAILVLAFSAQPVFERFYPRVSRVRSWLAGFVLIALAMLGLAACHEVMLQLKLSEFSSGEAGILASTILAAAVLAAFIGVAARKTKLAKTAKGYIYALITIALLFVLELVTYLFLIDVGQALSWWELAVIPLAIMIVLVFVDINKTSLHPYYRTKLAKAFLLNTTGEPAKAIKLSDAVGSKAMFPIINCAVNLPGSNKPDMRGRKADLFSFTPVSAGSTVVQYWSIKEWEKSNDDLDLATAMALSGAAVSPQMGLNTQKHTSFWLTFFNLRLGAWVSKPNDNSCFKAPGLNYLAREFLGLGKETDGKIYISDGGHIENLGIYELLRRRCRFIVAVDGENDSAMTFHGLTNLQRLAYIDHGITIDIDLQDLRLGGEGVSRSHFQFCRIRYPASKSKEEEIGYLIYLKLSLTGNEGEFIRRFKYDEPAFPHHSTANQFFTETQYEAYRNLGEHIGDKMFLKALTGINDSSSVRLDDWFKGLGLSFLDARP